MDNQSKTIINQVDSRIESSSMSLLDSVCRDYEDYLKKFYALHGLKEARACIIDSMRSLAKQNGEEFEEE